LQKKKNEKKKKRKEKKKEGRELIHYLNIIITIIE
jgi:hypothetical protein